MKGRVGFWAALVLVGGGAVAQEVGFKWPAPAGWGTGTIPFPLAFAPELRYQGIEEIRFAPGFVKPVAEDYWTFGFVWWLAGAREPDQKRLETDLTGYFAGLCRAAGGEKRQFDPARFSAKLDPAPEKREVLGHAAQLHQGPVQTYDPFGTGKELTLNVRVLTWECPTAARRAVLVTASPRPRDGAVGKTLLELESAFACH